MKTIEKKLGITFENIALLKTALTHSSYANENYAEGKKDYERMEFLGDAILDLIITEVLFNQKRHEQEGVLTKMRSHIVREESLAKASRALAIGDHMLFGRGEAHSGGRNKSSILSDVYESIVAAIFLDKGYTEAKKFVLRTLGDTIQKAMEEKLITDYKSTLQEFTHSAYGQSPKYTLIDEKGPDHQKEFVVEVSLLHWSKKGQGYSKKAAEQNSAEKLYHALLEETK